mgnify:CR=1 FL=1
MRGLEAGAAQTDGWAMRVSERAFTCRKLGERDKWNTMTVGDELLSSSRRLKRITRT